MQVSGANPYFLPPVSAAHGVPTEARVNHDRVSPEKPVPTDFVEGCISHTG